MKRILIIALGAGLLFGACSKDDLDIKPTRYISKKDIDRITETSPHLMEATMNGLYAYNVKQGSGGTTGHDDFGQKGYDIYTDMLAGDMVLNSTIYGWYSGIADLSDFRNYASLEAFKPWRFYYYMVRGTNNVLVGYLDEQDKPLKELSDKEKGILAQAYAMRAYMYYNLVNLYTTGYDANEKILPIYVRPILTNTPAKTTQEVFALMESDLRTSLKYFEEANMVGKGPNINYNVAKGILAYVLAAKGTTDALTEVITITDELKGAYPLANQNQLLGGFNKVASNPNWMWSAQLTTENDLDLVSWWGQVDIYTYSYAAVGDTKGLNKDLFDAIRADDIRLKQFETNVVEYDEGEEVDFGTDILPVNKFFSSLGKTFMGQRLIVSDYVFMRVEEMYLLNAEAKARLNQDGPAVDALKELLDNRITDLSYLDGLSGDALKKEVLFQTRLELWGEGKALAAFKRNKADIVYGSNHLFFAGTVFSYNDKRLVIPVPQSEILNNPVYNN
ncbi:RagB/SusD family nutrient uptake outer membrane protein [Myroides sp. 1354]|uniref:RagB/SusD family nutrient uptake outer membrane protein n=1 Tax=unclassified Myroides TaxID=2642485 RepID=UPI002576E5C8|nr:MULTISPECIES: RagB/SusD family nutrient uptake outer membrane protein [unclassified Myroides]MDM1043881.1 RagB/SusD family nutrient uptake outer membrane protein [Myroides sp. R163-1]MDM1054816.1 RagB/SusD family nutrient uptake outer membrane protein [Myroides sp. 1354]MDM1068113.1 RagB/SusD family nutrient uptake outer membrane protein [Myroides sp. 1372]